MFFIVISILMVVVMMTMRISQQPEQQHNIRGMTLLSTL
jgi:hypothetical protein